MTRTLVLLHGFMGSALNWGPILTRLKQNPDLQDWHFVTPDLLGHGGRRGPEALGYDTLSHARLCEDLKLQLPQGRDLVALGHSFGLRPLLLLSADPEWGSRMKALIVEDASPELTEESAAHLRTIVNRVPVPFASREEAKKTLQEIFAPDTRLAAFLFSNIRAQASDSHTWRFDKTGLMQLLDEAAAHPLWSEWANYSGPTFILRGEHSDHLSPERLQRALDRRSSKPPQVVQIPQSGHWIHSDQPELFAEELVKYSKLSEFDQSSVPVFFLTKKAVLAAWLSSSFLRRRMISVTSPATPKRLRSIIAISVRGSPSSALASAGGA
jgi:esterase